MQEERHVIKRKCNCQDIKRISNVFFGLSGFVVEECVDKRG